MTLALVAIAIAVAWLGITIIVLAACVMAAHTDRATADDLAERRAARHANGGAIPHD